MFPNIDEENFRNGNGEESRFSFEVLIFSSFSSVRSFDVHDEYVDIFSFRHPDSCGSTSAFSFITSRCPSMPLPVPSSPLVLSSITSHWLRTQKERRRTLCRLSSFILLHDVELGPKEPVQQRTYTDTIVRESPSPPDSIRQRTLSSRLRTENRNEIISKSLVVQLPILHMLIQLRSTLLVRVVSCLSERGRGMHSRE